MKRLACALALVALAFQKQPSRDRAPGPAAGSGYLLPNGWTITPAGEQIEVGDLPLALVLHPDGKRLLVSNNGNGVQSIEVLDVAARKTVARAQVELKRTTVASMRPLSSDWLKIVTSPITII